ncbi:flagellar biosynthesis regulator FlaF [Caldovatus aquaticus]|uniref:Flagellar biosynthesis regulator FlaF n=1 Tax=Caldovatus aquaticus TaxID=2865671 RepID=A0ABS7F496_9PROT|nr:flagellar biosynthesis regulator FlaF [Caldovatus aquaticus]MBW8270437.1 flagellar biosynthesis regulator FlaF [Caldovatus aquaticus]
MRSAAARYAAVQDSAASAQDIEIRAFTYVNGLLAAAGQGRAARIQALYKTHRLWSLLLDDLLSDGNRLPPELRARLVSLGLWAQRESLARMSDEGSVEPLIALHRDLAEGLAAQRRGAGAPGDGGGPAAPPFAASVA